MQRILVCHTGGWIGDMVLITPTLRKLKEIYPSSFLTILLRPLVADLMSSNPYVDRCIIDSKNAGALKSIFGLVKTIRRLFFDIAIILHPTSYRNAFIPYLARIPMRIGSNYRGRATFFTSTVSHTESQHEVERYLRILQLLSLDDTSVSVESYNTSDSPAHLEFWHSDDERETVAKILLSNGISTSDRLIALNIGTTWQTKQWKIRNFSELIRRITDLKHNISIIVTGSKTEQNLSHELPISNKIVNLVGKTDILQLGALLEKCELCISGDSGPMHIAAAVGTPTIALFGPTDPLRHRPYGVNHTIIEKPISCRPCYKTYCHRKDAPNVCMNEITVQEVVDEITRKLQI